MKLQILSQIPLSVWEEKLCAYLFLEKEHEKSLQFIAKNERLQIMNGITFLRTLDPLTAQKLSLEIVGTE